jgi:DNA-binding Lrp family transcriptional regulator
MRIKRLIEEGYIKQYTVILDQKKIGKGLVGYVQVQLRQHSTDNIRSFVEQMKQVPGVIECSHMTGSFDFLLKIAVRDMDQYQQLLIDRLAALPGVENIQSFFVISEQRMKFILL